MINSDKEKNLLLLLLGHDSTHTSLNSHHTVLLGGSLAWWFVVAPLDTFPDFTGGPFNVFFSNLEIWSDFLSGFVDIVKEMFLVNSSINLKFMHISLHFLVNIVEFSINFVSFVRNISSSFVSVV